MIKSKKVNDIQLDMKKMPTGYRSSAFGVYLNLLEKFDSKELVLLESLGPGSIDTKVSLIGINPVLHVEVFDQIVTISGNKELLKEIQLLYSEERLIEVGGQALKYQLASRNVVWGFLRALDDQFKTVEGGVLAFATFAYNTIYFIEDIPGYTQGDIPDIHLTCYSTFIEFEDKRVRLHEYEFTGSKCISLSDISSCISFGDVHPDRFSKVKFSVNKETHKSNYLQKAAVALRHVQIGDVYQIQIGQKITVSADISALDVYAKLRLLNPSPYMYLFNTGHSRVIGASPELFVYMKNQYVMMRPIAGTLGKSIVATKKIAEAEFNQNPKEIAEHMMLVDLCRNDLCKVSLPQTLSVSELMTVEEYSHVYHMISTAKSQARQDCDKYDVIKASFPAGTMTGTPKIRAIELISEIEDSGRGLYAGALGMIGLGYNYINTALCIRTAIECDHKFSLRASAGIVSDSMVESEYTETLHKMGSVFKAITNEEISCHVV
jgi:anthranilate synthase component 1